MVIGTLNQILEASESSKGPILNALSFPLPLTGVIATKFSTEVTAWKLTQGELFCPPEMHFPVGDIRWGLAALEGARHWIHIDSDGFGTFVDVQCGAKWWILFNPADGMNRSAFGDIYQYLDDYQSNADDGSFWDRATKPGNSSKDTAWVAEAIYLTPGTRLQVFFVHCNMTLR